MNYLVLIADIVASKQIPLREKTQEELKIVLQILNERNIHRVSPYTITLGDEFQAVFSNADHFFHDAIQVLSAVYPVKVRFSLGVGSVLTEINHSMAIGMDGPAFYNARRGMDDLKNSNSLFAIEGIETGSNALVRECLNLVSYNCINWNRNRLRVFASLYEKKDIQRIATELGISDKAVYKTISEGNLTNIFRLLKEITLIINRSLV